MDISKQELKTAGFGVVVMFCGLIVRGFVVMKLSQWFTPDPFDVQPLTFAQALVIVFALYLFSFRRNTKSESVEVKEIALSAIYWILYYALFLGMGWVIKMILI